MKQDNRLKKFIGKKVFIQDKEHPWANSVGVGKKFNQVATGDWGLVVDLENGQECYVFDFSSLKLLSTDEEVVLTQEETIEQLAAANYGVDQIALYLGIDKKEFRAEWENVESEIRHHYDRGQLVADFEINQKLLANAKSGNITAAQIFEKNRERVQVENLKEQIYFGTE